MNPKEVGKGEEKEGNVDVGIGAGGKMLSWDWKSEMGFYYGKKKVRET